MSDATPHPNPDPEAAPPGDRARTEAVEAALAAGDRDRVRALALPLHYADVADLIEALSSEQRAGFVHALGADLPPDALADLDETVRDEVIEHLGVRKAASAISELDTDDAVEVIGELDAAEQREILAAIPGVERALIEEALAYPEDSAGRLMQREMVAVPSYWTVGETIDHIRKSADVDPDALPSDFYDIFVVDAAFHPVGAVPLSQLLRNKRGVAVADVMTTAMKVVPVSMDQEEIAFLFRQRDLVSAPVVTASGRLVGQITIDDVVDVIDEEMEEDIMHLGGVRAGDLYTATLETTRSRFPWLFVTLGSAVLASAVVGLFEATIEQVVALAILLPIVALVGGNAGIQTMTVTVRALATRELSPANAMRVIGKEMLVGGINGVLLGGLAGAVAWAWFGEPLIAMVIALAMLANLIAAALAGISIPLVLNRLGIDPAAASGVFLTAITDVVGFAAFLGLGTLLLV